MIRYAISVLAWGVIAVILILTGKIVYLTFWALLGALLILFWIGHVLYHVLYLFNPDFKPIKIVIFMVVLVAAVLVIFKISIAPRWNRWGSTQEEIDSKYEVDNYCPDAELRTIRTVEINGPKDYVFRWVEQISNTRRYGDYIFGFRGGDKFRKLRDDLPELKEGDEFFIGKIVDIDDEKSVTFDIGSDPRLPKMGISCMYGGYYFRDAGNDRTRVIMVMRADYEGISGWFYSQVIVEIADFFVTTRQLSRLKEAAESQFSN